MKVALDTKAYSDFLRGDPVRVDVVRRAEQIFVPLVVLGELCAGFAADIREAENLAILRQFLASPRVSVLLPDAATVEHYAVFFCNFAGKVLRFRPTISGSPHSRSSTM